MTSKKYILAFAILFLILQASFAQINDNQIAIERYALYVASNQGTETRETLRYAGTDAEGLAKTMSDLGGVENQKSKLLIDPTRQDIENAFDSFSSLITENKDKARRTEFLFYYSGHSDETALLLGNDSYDYSSLKKDLSLVPSDVHVVMLDSCFSGNFIRTKGGSRQKPFLVDDSTIVQGYAYLSSSSEYEPSQESDAIEGSYFTNALITGLRGAADTTGDEKVSLNELYYYAFNETLAQTETSSAGPQHPSYNITLVGSGDLILTDISTAESVLVIPANTSGQFYIRNSNGNLVSQVNKVAGKEVPLALPTGYYTVSLVNGGITSQSSVQLARNTRTALNMSNFDEAVLVATTRRGDNAPTNNDAVVAAGASATAATAATATVAAGTSVDDYAYYDPMQDPFFADLYAFINRQVQNQVVNEEADDDIETEIHIHRNNNNNDNTSSSNKTYSPFALSIFNNVSFPSPMPDLVNASVSAFTVKNSRIFGAQAASFIGTVEESLIGVQATGFMSISNGDTKGAQGSGFMNIARGQFLGVQGTGFMNIAKQDMRGVQGSGFMNITSGNTYGVQGTGFMNITSGNTYGVQGSGFMNITGEKMYGVQLSSFMNISEELNGVAIAPINISSGGNGVPIGILNFIKDGVCEPSVYYDSEENLFFQYKGGTKTMFTTLLFCLNPPTNITYWGGGIGSRATLDKLSVDLEALFLGKCSSLEKEIDFTTDYISFYPMARITGRFSIAKHFGVYVSYDAKINVTSWNDNAFVGSKLSSSSLWDDSVRIYHGVSFGLHF